MPNPENFVYCYRSGDQMMTEELDRVATVAAVTAAAAEVVVL